MSDRRHDAVEAKIRRDAESMVERRLTAAEYSSRVFGPDGLLRQLWKTKEERKLLVASTLYRDLRDMMGRLERDERSAFEAETERLSGRLTIMVPKSLHAALRVEAAREGISLSELIRLKLGVPYRLTAEWIAKGTSTSEAA